MSRLTGVIKRKEKPMQLIRHAGITSSGENIRSDGKATRPRQEIKNGAAVIMNIDGDTLAQLEDGDRKEAALIMYSRFKPIESNQQVQTVADLIIWKGCEWKIIKLFDRTTYGCYYKTVLGLYRKRPQDIQP